ncbi:hypothetical protein N7V09_12965 [Shewanella seohaensis]|uniref:hypothetical protein n=1 Tax=Shewanella seohaensis TaxID=755175 RepID=UPI0021C71824|nr:hypothetical protein [Shewanella seohaensis]UXM80794.1 hypothetical protein N7V09_12965 [Shewanella seohaensis]
MKSSAETLSSTRMSADLISPQMNASEAHSSERQPRMQESHKTMVQEKMPVTKRVSRPPLVDTCGHYWP